LDPIDQQKIAGSTRISGLILALNQAGPKTVVIDSYKPRLGFLLKAAPASVKLRLGKEAGLHESQGNSFEPDLPVGRDCRLGRWLPWFSVRLGRHLGGSWGNRQSKKTAAYREQWLNKRNKPENRQDAR
jgi:hypothetical protein